MGCILFLCCLAAWYSWRLSLIFTSLSNRVGISLFLAGSGVQNFWANGVQNSCVKVPLVKCNGNSEYMEKWEKYVAYTWYVMPSLPSTHTFRHNIQWISAEIVKFIYTQMLKIVHENEKALLITVHSQTCRCWRSWLCHFPKICQPQELFACFIGARWATGVPCFSPCTNTASIFSFFFH